VIKKRLHITEALSNARLECHKMFDAVDLFNWLDTLNTGRVTVEDLDSGLRSVDLHIP
jgi:hypothetical protein